MKRNIYEAMFLFNPAIVVEWAAGEAEMRRLLERAEAQILGLKRWDERKLAYEIEGQKRGVYGLVFFEADGDKIAPLERDAQLSETVMRLLVLRTEGMTQELIDKVMASAAPPRQIERGDGWGSHHDRRPAERAAPAPAAEMPESEIVAAPAEELDTAEVR